MDWPTYRMARELAGTVFPVSEAVILQTARKHDIGRKMGRCVIFSPEDCQHLYEKLSCPSGSSAAPNRPTGSSAAPSAASALRKVLALTTKRSPRRSAPSARPKSSLNPSTVVAFAAACRRAGIKNFTPHCCRHTWATWHYAKNRDLLALQRLGGWKSLAMVTRYAHVNVGELAQTIDNLPWPEVGGKLGDTASTEAKSA